MLSRVPNAAVDRVKRRLLLADWNQRARRGVFDRRIPPPAINYNYAPVGTATAYAGQFGRNALLHELPVLLEIDTHVSDELVLLDYGCGLGPLAFAFSEYFGSDPAHRYVGYEVHPAAYAFLCGAYQDFPNITFLTDRLIANDSYAEFADRRTHTGSLAEAGIAAADVHLKARLPDRVDIQYSISVFTHMRTDAISGKGPRAVSMTGG